MVFKQTFQRWRQRAKELKTETYAIYLAYKDPRVAWYAKVFAACVVAYALSPIDLIPDFIPVLGYLDDLILVPLGIAGVIKMIPPDVLAECREKAQLEMRVDKPTNWIAAIIIVFIWLLLVAGAVVLILRIFKVGK
ncbi:MAG: YkvA family protein [Anaerolineales bacterium]